MTMKNWLSIILLVITALGCKPKTGPIASYKSRFVDLGSIKLKGTYHGTFLLKNIGDEDLKIKGVTSDCECTVVKGYADVIPPNKSALIHYDLKPHTVGFDQQNIFIKNNSAKENVILVAIRAKIEL